MASRRDIEEGTVPDERAPLLPQDSQARVRRDSNAAPDSDDLALESKAISNKWQYIWKALLAVFTIIVIAIFVKGWIDADDVDVSLLPTKLSVAVAIRLNETDHIMIVRLERCAETSVGRWTQRGRCYGSPGPAFDANSDHHELPIPPWLFFDCRN